MTRDEILKMEAGRELDAAVAEKIMGWTNAPNPHGDGTFREWRDNKNQFIMHFPDWAPSTDISAAWKVIEKIGGTYRIHNEYNDVSVIFWKTGTVARAKTAPEAICKAALIAAMEG